MPALANITVKAADGTTDVLYTAMNPASGSGPALWRALSIGTTSASHPWLTMSSRENGNGTGRRIDYRFEYPQVYTTTTTGLVAVANRCVMTGSYLLPLGVPDATSIEPAHQFGNLMSSNLIRGVFYAGFAPT